jgi:hypothetical protein
MPSFLKFFVAPLMVAVLAAAFAFWLGRSTAPDIAILQGELRWVDIESPIYHQPAGFVRTYAPFLPGNINTKSPAFALFVSAVDRLRLEKNVRVAVLTLRNDSNIKTQGVEVTVEAEGLMYSGQMDGEQIPASAHIDVKPIDPGSKTNVYIVAPSWSRYIETVRALQGGKKVAISVQEVPEGFDSLITLVGSHPTLYYFALLFMVMFVTLVLLILPFAIALRSSVGLRAWTMNAAEVKRLTTLLDYIKQRYPEKSLNSAK